MRSVVELPDRPISVGQFTTGHANLTYLLEFGDVRLVLRRPPRGTIAPGAHDMHREQRVLSKLGAVFRRAPMSLHFSDEAAILGAPFILLEYRDGVVVDDRVPCSMEHHPDVVRRLDLALMDAADLHIVDVEAAGLADLGKPAGFAARQVAGWTERWRRVALDVDIPAMWAAAERLRASSPDTSCVSVIHNDLKLNNCQFHPDDPDVVRSVFDWDMATIGDPLFDLGVLLVSMAMSPLWVLSTAEALERYSARSRIDIGAIDWYAAFAKWRTAIVAQQLRQRYQSGDSTDHVFAGSRIEGVGSLAEQAFALLDR